MISTEDRVELAIRGLEVYAHGSEERLIQDARGDRIDGLEAASVLKRSKKEKRLEDWKIDLCSYKTCRGNANDIHFIFPWYKVKFLY